MYGKAMSLKDLIRRRLAPEAALPTDPAGELLAGLEACSSIAGGRSASLGAAEQTEPEPIPQWILPSRGGGACPEPCRGR
jgi:hypothetical protein